MLRLDTDDADVRRHGLDDRADARDQSGTADRDDDRLHARGLLEDLDAQRSLAGDDVFVVVRGKEGEPLRFRKLQGTRSCIDHVVAVQLDGGAELTAVRDFDQRRELRHDDGHRDAKQAAVIGHAQRVVACRCCNDAAAPLFRRQAQQGIACPAFLEAAGALQIIELAPDARTGELRERNRLDAGRFVNAATDAFPRGEHVVQRNHRVQNGSVVPGRTSRSTRRKSPWIRRSAASSSASKRSTTTGVVFDARARPNPSGYSTRSPSRRMTSSASGNVAVRCSSAISACCSPSLHARLSSGVESASGSAFSTAEGSSWRDRISSIRAPLYRPSSKPYQRSPKNVCPLISPASSAPVSFIFALINECPVFHSNGLPPWRSIHGRRLRVDLTS